MVTNVFILARINCYEKQTAEKICMHSTDICKAYITKSILNNRKTETLFLKLNNRNKTLFLSNFQFSIILPSPRPFSLHSCKNNFEQTNFAINETTGNSNFKQLYIYEKPFNGWSCIHLTITINLNTIIKIPIYGT